MSIQNMLASAKKGGRGKCLVEALQALWRNPGVSRAELGEILEVSKTASTATANRLLAAGLVEELEGVSTKPGNRPVPLRVKSDAAYSAGVSFSCGSKAEICLVNAACEKVASVSTSFADNSVKGKCAATAGILRELAKNSKIPLDSLAGAGVELTGIFDPLSGEVMTSSQFDLSKGGGSVSALLEKELGMPVILINNPHLLAFLEKRDGKAVSMKSFLYMTCGTGLGMVLNGKLYRGHQFNAGETGFMQVSDEGPVGRDGRSGLLCDMAALYKITDRLDEIIAGGGSPKVKKLLSESSNGKVSLEMVVKATKDGDMLCEEMLSEKFSYIAKAAVNLAYAFNPEAIFLPPWTGEIPSCTLDVIRRRMGHYGAHHWGLKTEISSAKFGDESLAFGAALLPLDKLFNHPALDI